jgi:hypothetical protein
MVLPAFDRTFGSRRRRAAAKRAAALACQKPKKLSRSKPSKKGLERLFRFKESGKAVDCLSLWLWFDFV